MLRILSYLFNKNELLKTLGLPRSSRWKTVRSEFLSLNPCCSVCGSKKNVVPHHKVPFHVDPSLELDPSNLISLCENKGFNCHFFFGHLRNWAGHNPTVEEDAIYWCCRLSEKKF